MRAIVLTLPGEKKISFQGVKSERFLDELVIFFEKIGVVCERIDYADTEIWEKLRKSDFLVCRPKGTETDLSIASSIIQEAEAIGLTCFPSAKEVFYCGDKYRVESFFAVNNLPRPNTHAIFTDEDLKKIEGLVEFPAVAKLIRGASSRNVTLVHSMRDVEKIWKSLKRLNLIDGDVSKSSYMFSRLPVVRSWLQPHKVMKEKCLIIQDLVPGCSGDIRVTTFQDRAYIFERRNRPGDFRASGSGHIEYGVEGYHPNLAKSALELSTRFGFNSMAYDFLISHDEQPLFIEMNYTYVPQALAACPVFYDAAGRTEHSDGISPQELIGRGLLEKRRGMELVSDSEKM